MTSVNVGPTVVKDRATSPEFLRCLCPDRYSLLTVQPKGGLRGSTGVRLGRRKDPGPHDSSDVYVDKDYVSICGGYTWVHGLSRLVNPRVARD